MPDSAFNPAYTPPLPPPDNFAMDDVIGDQTTLGAAAYPPDPAQDDLVFAPMGPMAIMYIVILTMFVLPDMMQGHTAIHGQYFDLATGAGRLSHPVDLHPPWVWRATFRARPSTVWLADEEEEE